MTAWRFGAPQLLPAARVYASPQSTDFRPAPFLVMGSGPKVYVLDDPLASGGAAGAAGAGGGSGAGGFSGAAGVAGSAGAMNGGAADSSAGGGPAESSRVTGDQSAGRGCRQSAPAPRAPLWLGVSVLGLAFGRRRTRRRLR
jgi:hypothetical protein